MSINPISFFRHTYILFLSVSVMLVASCSDADYMSVIPRDCMAVMRINVSDAVSKSGSGITNRPGMLKSFFCIDDIKESGIDFTEPIYAFETSDGNIGVVAKVGSKGKLEDWLTVLHDNGKASEIKERKGFGFSIVNGSYMAGFSGSALLVMGPVASSSVAEVQRRMIRYLDSDDGAEVKSARIMQYLDTMDGNIALVAQANALPERFVAPFMIGAPKNARPADIIIAASFEQEGRCLNITGETFSFNPDTDSVLKESMKAYKPITGKHIDCIPYDASVSVICGVDGNDYIDLLRRNDTFRVLLAGLNTAIDIDKMLKSVNGDMLMTFGNIGNGKPHFSLIAEVSDAGWLEDVGYWKASTPSGTSITDWKFNDSYHFNGGDWNAYFGLTSDNMMYICSSESLASAVQARQAMPFPDDIAAKIKGKHLCAVINIGGILDGNPQMKALTGSILGNVERIVYFTK
ncbi:DUF4836 family protein [Xylanibacter muris]|uniref:DUF4836 family protein n=2 Tax=Xylanibacter muris TaxID=2736290 RepID=A0ABX2AMS1_9BACT|nr:DUF4836 family protein [Xylanibacter muris]NPD92203.1 DUF4836 family protein [Xylanibacter muris]